MGKALLMAGLVVAVACNQAVATEASPSELLAQANTKLRSAKTSHMEGTGTLAVKAGGAVAFDLKLRGDAEIPGKTRLNTELTILGQALSVDTITIDGRTFTRQGLAFGWEEGVAGPNQGLNPLGQLDLTRVSGVIEIDRPEIDGRKTRHLKYTIESENLLRQLLDSATAPSFRPSNAVGTGEVWIATDDGQLVRQIVNIAFDIENAGGLGLPGTGGGTNKARFEAAFDLKYTLIGRPVSPAITAPPTSKPVLRNGSPKPSP